MAKKKARAAGSNAKPRNVRSAQTDRRNVRSAQNPAPITPDPKALVEALRDTADQFGNFRAKVFAMIGVPAEGETEYDFTQIIRLLKDLTNEALTVTGVSFRSGSLGDAIYNMRLRLLTAIRALTPHDKAARDPGATGEATEAGKPPANWYTAQEWETQLVAEIPGQVQGGLFSLKAVAELLATHCNKALAKGWEMSQGVRTSRTIDEFSDRIVKLQNALQPFVDAWQKHVDGHTSVDHTAATHFRNAAAVMKATIPTIPPPNFARSFPPKPSYLSRDTEEQPATMAAETRLAILEQALRETTHALPSGHIAKGIGEVALEQAKPSAHPGPFVIAGLTTQALLEVLKKHGYQTSAPLSAASRAKSVDRWLSERQQADDRSDSWKNLEMFASQKGWKRDEAPGIIAWVMEQIDGAQAKQATQLPTTWETEAKQLRDALAPFNDLGIRLKKSLDTNPPKLVNGVALIDLRICNGHNFLVGTKLELFEQAMAVYGLTRFEPETMPQDMAGKILRAAKRISQRIHVAGCWAADFVADVAHEELAPLIQGVWSAHITERLTTLEMQAKDPIISDTLATIMEVVATHNGGLADTADAAQVIHKAFARVKSLERDLEEERTRAQGLAETITNLNKFLGGFPDKAVTFAAQDVVAARDQAQKAVLEMQQALGILGLPEALQRIKELLAFESDTKRNLRTIRDDLGLQDSESILFAINERHEKAADFDDIAQTAASRGLRADENIVHWLADTCDRADRATKFFIQLQAMIIAFRKAVQLLRHAEPKLYLEWPELREKIRQFLQSPDPCGDLAPFTPGDMIECRSPRYTDGKPASGKIDVCEQYDSGIWFVRYHDQNDPPSMLYDRADECTLLQTAAERKAVNSTDLRLATNRDNPTP